MKVIKVQKCDECPFFIPSWEENCKQTRVKVKPKVTPINPDAYDLDDDNEK